MPNEIVSAFTFKPATRAGIKPLVGLFGKSGGGKTLTACLLARGIVGPSGKIGVADTENDRALVFSEMVPGGFLHLRFDPPFSPERYAGMVDAAESAGMDILVVDSATHEWNGEGGYLDMKEEALARMAGNDWKKREKCGMAAAAQCKPKHNKFVQRLLRTRMAVILCFRAKDTVKMEKKDDGKTEIVKGEYANPIQESGLIFEMLISGEVCRVDGKCGCLRIDPMDPNTKWTHPDIRKIFPGQGEQLTIGHGEALARWCADPSKPKAAPNLPGMRLRIAQLTGVAAEDVNEYLWSEGLMADTEAIEELQADRLTEIGTKLSKKTA